VKKLQVNQMENLQGGSLAYFAAMFAYASAIKAFIDDPNEFTSLGLVLPFGELDDACAKFLSYQLI
jgi:hypothetical protein